MRSGRLNRLVTLQRLTVSQDDAGGAVETWTNIVDRWPASVTVNSGGERSSYPQTVSQDLVEFRIRKSSEVFSLGPKCRVIYPALSEDSPDDVPDDYRTFDIQWVAEIGNTDLKIVAKRRQDAGVVS